MKIVVFGPHRRTGVLQDGEIVDIASAFAKCLHARDVDRHHCGDVGDAEAVRGDVVAPGQAPVQRDEALLYPCQAAPREPALAAMRAEVGPVAQRADTRDFLRAPLVRDPQRGREGGQQRGG